MELLHKTGYLLNRCSRLLKRKVDACLKPYGITSSQWAVIELLSEKGPQSQAEIAESLSMDRATFGTILNKLIARGFLEKELSETDRRSYYVKMRPPGVALVEEVRTEIDGMGHLILNGMSDADVAKLRELLCRIISNVTEDTL